MALIAIHDLRIRCSSYRLVLDPLVLLGAALLEGFWVREVFRRRKAAGKLITMCVLSLS